MSKTFFTTPVTGRLIMGDVYELRTQNDEVTKQPKLIKTGPNAGKPLQQRFIAIAIPKTAATLEQEPWFANPSQGQTVSPLAATKAAWPAGQHAWPKFARKIIDGDQPNDRGQFDEYSRGCWVVKGQTSGVIKVYSWVNGQLAVNDQAGAVKCGDYMQAQFEYSSNTSDVKPGMYCTPLMVCFTKAGEAIERGYAADPTAAGFAQGEALAGTVTQQSTGFAPAPATIQPVAGFSTGAAVAAPPPPPAAPAPEQRRLQDGSITTRDALLSGGWSPAQVDQYTVAV